MKLNYFLLTLVLVAPCFIETDGYRILGFFYFQARSHFVIFESLMKGLAAHGHEVVVISHFPQKTKLPNYTDISIQGCSKKILSSFSIEKVRNFRVKNFFYFQWDENVQYCEEALNHPDVQKLIHSDEKFDLIVSGLFAVDCWAGFAHKFKVPVINMVSSVASPWSNSRVGNPDNPSYIPNFFLSYRAPMSFRDRLINTVTYLFTTWGQYYRAEQPTDRVLHKYFGDDMPPVSEFVQNVSLVFVNSHFSLNQPRPAVPAFVEIGGIHITPAKKLTKEIQTYLDEAPHGVIFFSYGSMINASSLPEEKIQAYVEAFRELPQRILWKLEENVVKNIPPNVKIAAWLPQMDVLNHPNVKAFLSHGGLHSTEEAVYTGKPVVGTPFFFDQEQNIAALEDLGMAYRLNYDDITKKSLLTAVKAVLEDPRYREAAERQSALFRDRPKGAMETAIYWTEYVIRHKGAPHLRSAAIDMPFYQYLLLDVIAVLLLPVVIALLLFWVLIRKLMALINTENEHKKKEKRH